MRNYQTKSNVGALPDSIASTRFGAGEFNSIASELEGAVTTSDQTLAPSDGTGESTDQLAKSLSIYGAGGASYHKDTGAVNAYVLNPVSPKKSPDSYFDGFVVIFEPGTTNTGASTVNVASIGIKSITYSDGTALVGGEISGSTVIKYSLGNDRFELVANNTSLLGMGSQKNLVTNAHFNVVGDVGPKALTTAVTVKTADGWGTFQNTSANGIDAVVASGITGDANALKIGRNVGGTETGEIGAQFALRSYDSIPLQSKVITLKVKLKAGANWSGSNVNVGVLSGTGIDEPVGNIGSWTGVAGVIGIAQTITSSWVEYTFTGTVSSSATQLGIRFYYAPTGTAGSDDNLYIASVQLYEGVGSKTEQKTNERSLVEIMRLRPVGSGRLSNYGVSDPFTQVQFVQHNGNIIIIDDRYELIPFGALSSSGGVVADYDNCYIDGVASQTMVTDTLYYAYVWMNNGSMDLDFSTTSQAFDQRNGTYVKSGDTTRAFVGLVYPQDYGGTLYTYGGSRGQTVCSYFNPFDWVIVTAIVGPTTATTPTALPSGGTTSGGQPSNNFVEWVSFGDKLPKLHFFANAGHSVSGATIYLGLGLNSTSTITGFTATAQTVSTSNTSINLYGRSSASDSGGYFYCQAIGYSGTAGTTQFNGQINVDTMTP